MPDYGTEVKTSNIGIISIRLKTKEAEIIDVIPDEILDSTQEHKDFEEYFRSWSTDKIKRYEENKDQFFKKDEKGNVVKVTVTRDEYIQRIKEAEKELKQTFEAMKEYNEPEKLQDSLFAGLKEKADSAIGKDVKNRDFELDKLIMKELASRIVTLELDKEELSVKINHLEKEGNFREGQIKTWQEKGFFALIGESFRKLFRKG